MDKYKVTVSTADRHDQEIVTSPHQKHPVSIEEVPPDKIDFIRENTGRDVLRAVEVLSEDGKKLGWLLSYDVAGRRFVEADDSIEVDRESKAA